MHSARYARSSFFFAFGTICLYTFFRAVYPHVAFASGRTVASIYQYGSLVCLKGIAIIWLFMQVIIITNLFYNHQHTELKYLHDTFVQSFYYSALTQDVNLSLCIYHLITELLLAPTKMSYLFL